MSWYNTHRRPRNMQLGANYMVYWKNNPNVVMFCKWIQPTRCGFNLLNMSTNKCILNQHCYPDKKKAKGQFWFNTDLIIVKV